MGAGLSSESFRKKEAYVMQNFEKEKKRMSRYKNCDGKNRYNDEQIKMKIRQDYHNNGYYKNSIVRNDFIPHAHWHLNR
jgi:hypothetical protein